MKAKVNIEAILVSIIALYMLVSTNVKAEEEGGLQYTIYKTSSLQHTPQEFTKASNGYYHRSGFNRYRSNRNYYRGNRYYRGGNSYYRNKRYYKRSHRYYSPRKYYYGNRFNYRHRYRHSY